MAEIKIHVFWKCAALKIVRLPDGIPTANCLYQSGIEEVYIPDSVTTVSHFTECLSLRKVDIGTGIKTFNQNSFNGDTALAVFIMRAMAPPSYAGWTCRIRLRVRFMYRMKLLTRIRWQMAGENGLRG